MRVMQSDEHPVSKVDPFGFLPCSHEVVTVHITDAESMGRDIVECKECGYTVTLADLYEPMFPKSPPVDDAP
jgi:hypothetical protein